MHCKLLEGDNLSNHLGGMLDQVITSVNEAIVALSDLHQDVGTVREEIGDVAELRSVMSYKTLTQAFLSEEALYSL